MAVALVSSNTFAEILLMAMGASVLNEAALLAATTIS